MPDRDGNNVETFPSKTVGIFGPRTDVGVYCSAVSAPVAAW